MSEKGQTKAAKDSKALKRVVSNLLITTIVITVASSILIFLGLTYIFGIIVLGLMPSVVANVVEKRKKRFASKTVSAFNLAGILPYFFKLGQMGNPNSAARELIVDPFVWVVIYGLATCGWVMVQVIPQFVFLILLIRSEFTKKKLKSFQDELVKEWGDVIKK